MRHLSCAALVRVLHRLGQMLTISGTHEHLEGIDDHAVEGPAQEGAGAASGPFHGEAQAIVLVLHCTRQSLSYKSHIRGVVTSCCSLEMGKCHACLVIYGKFM